jgi:hypothetical protein
MQAEKATAPFWFVVVEADVPPPQLLASSKTAVAETTLSARRDNYEREIAAKR